MSVAIVTGSAGLVGSTAACKWSEEGFEIVGIDNDMRRLLFGAEASTRDVRKVLEKNPHYRHYTMDIREQLNIDRLFKHYGSNIEVVIHTAAQPSHDWAASDPIADFTINANGTLNLLESMRRHCPNAVFIFTSTNKVYGDLPNSVADYVEMETRWEPSLKALYNGFNEDLSIDQSKHSLFGVSKCAADLMVQEYGRYFGHQTVCFRCGCITGPNHAGAEAHGFLAYLMRCTLEGKKYNIYGHKGKQVRDNIHAADLVEAFWQFYRSPRKGEVYNMGGGRRSNCSVIEAIALCEEISGKSLLQNYIDIPRSGDHIWYISDTRKFEAHYPEWKVTRSLQEILRQMFAANYAPA